MGPGKLKIHTRSGPAKTNKCPRGRARLRKKSAHAIGPGKAGKCTCGWARLQQTKSPCGWARLRRTLPTRSGPATPGRAWRNRKVPMRLGPAEPKVLIRFGPGRTRRIRKRGWTRLHRKSAHAVSVKRGGGRKLHMRLGPASMKKRPCGWKRQPKNCTAVGPGWAWLQRKSAHAAGPGNPARAKKCPCGWARLRGKSAPGVGPGKAEKCTCGRARSLRRVLV